jgi:peptidyl-dipeptidase Dcp
MMRARPGLDAISIRTDLRAGDIGSIVHMHGRLYQQDYDYGTGFEAYVADGLLEFYRQYDPQKDRIWICEHRGHIAGSLVLMNRGSAAQLRYFLLQPEFRGIGLGKKLMKLFMDFMYSCGYTSSYLWTTDELLSAAALYKKFGYELTEEKVSSGFGKRVVEQKYELRLSSQTWKPSANRT